MQLSNSKVPATHGNREQQQQQDSTIIPVTSGPEGNPPPSYSQDSDSLYPSIPNDETEPLMRRSDPTTRSVPLRDRTEPSFGRKLGDTFREKGRRIKHLMKELRYLCSPYSCTIFGIIAIVVIAVLVVLGVTKAVISKGKETVGTQQEFDPVKYPNFVLKLGHGITGDIVITQAKSSSQRNVLVSSSSYVSTLELSNQLSTSSGLDSAALRAEFKVAFQMSDADIDRALQSGTEAQVKVKVEIPYHRLQYQSIEIDNAYDGKIYVDLDKTALQGDLIIRSKLGDVLVKNAKVNHELRLDAPHGHLKVSSATVEGVVKARALRDIDMQLSTSWNPSLDVQVTSETGQALLDLPNQFYGHFSVVATSSVRPVMDAPEKFTIFQTSNDHKIEGFVSLNGIEPAPLPRVEIKGSAAMLKLRGWD